MKSFLRKVRRIARVSYTQLRKMWEERGRLTTVFTAPTPSSGPAEEESSQSTVLPGSKGSRLSSTQNKRLATVFKSALRRHPELSSYKPLIEDGNVFGFWNKLKADHRIGVEERREIQRLILEEMSAKSSKDGRR
jgi:hypothetical protein